MFTVTDAGLGDSVGGGLPVGLTEGEAIGVALGEDEGVGVGDEMESSSSLSLSLSSSSSSWLCLPMLLCAAVETDVPS